MPVAAASRSLASDTVMIPIYALHRNHTEHITVRHNGHAKQDRVFRLTRFGHQHEFRMLERIEQVHRLGARRNGADQALTEPAPDLTDNFGVQTATGL